MPRNPIIVIALSTFLAVTARADERAERLLRGAEIGDLRAVRSALNEGADPNVHDSLGYSVLELVDMRKGDLGPLSDRAPSIKAASRRLDIVKLLLDRGARLKQVEKVETYRDQSDRALLHDALYFSRYDVAERLLSAGAPADEVNVFSIIRAHPWTRKQREQRAWFEKTLSDQRVKHWLPQALCEAAAAPDGAYFVRRLLENGGEVNARTYSGHTALTSAVVSGKQEVVRLLLGHGADPNLPFVHPKSAYLTSTIIYDGKTPLAIAAVKKNPAIVAMLREAGAHE